MDDYAEKAKKRLDEVMSRMDVHHILRMSHPRKWPFADMQVGDEVSFYPTCFEAAKAAHSHGQKRGKKFKSRSEWPLTIITRVA